MKLKNPKFDTTKNDQGVWEQEETEQTSLDFGSVPNYTEEKQHITLDVIDNFILSQEIDYDSGTEVKQTLQQLAEGYDYEQVAKKMKTTPTAVMNKLSEARQYFAPFAQVWKQLKEDEKHDA